ncbi:WD40/YVTN/BNR-like repeat-containing protein [Falsiroseomonas sp. HC035]|uniref:WD40/YVTN/BNR-like repeat-containing protein n=1 Tax=Falsiroseomonas sp. HC035 TaxID=3390999 RepID=UPI003D316FCD
MERRVRRRVWVGGALSAPLVAWNLAATEAPVRSRRANAHPVPSVETYAWRRVAIGGGGFITGLATDRTGATRLARSDVYGAYIWCAKQDRWVQLINTATMPVDDQIQDGMNEGVFEVAVAPGNPDRIYIAARGLVYRSDDRGAHFVSSSRTAPFPFKFDPNGKFRLGGPFLEVSPGDPDLVLFGTPEDGLWRSADAGANWAHVASVPHRRGGLGPGISLWFPPMAAGGGIWAMSPDLGLHVAADDGLTFRPLVSPGALQPLRLSQGAFAPDGRFFGVDHGSRSIWRYGPEGWTELSSRRGISPQRFVAIAVNPNGAQVLVFDEGGRTWQSRDAGESWSRMWHRSRVGAGDPPWLRVANQSYFAMGRVAFDPTVPNRLWVGAGTGFYRCDLARLLPIIEWVSETRGIEELVANDVACPPGDAPLFAAWDFGIHRKTSMDRFSTGYGPRERVLIAAQQLACSPADPRFIATNASDTRTFCCAEDGDAVMAGYSLDAGRSWRKFPTLPWPPGTAANDPWRMSFGTIAVASDDTRNIVWLPTFNRAPFYTRDRGASWHRVIFPGEVLPDTGSHAVYSYHRKTLAADPVQPGTFYLVHTGEGANAALAGLWVTRDAGASWVRVFRGEIAPHSQHSAKLRPLPGQAGHLFFTNGVAGNDDTRLRFSRDGGTSWVALNHIHRVDDLGFGCPADGSSVPTIFLSGRVNGAYGLWRSIDAAESWRRVGSFPVGTLDQVTVVAGDPDRFGRVYVGYKGSGWIYGEPAYCAASAYEFPSADECYAVR